MLPHGTATSGIGWLGIFGRKPLPCFSSEWLFAGALLKPIPWAEPKTQPPPVAKNGPQPPPAKPQSSSSPQPNTQAQPTRPQSSPSPQANTDVTVCSQGNSPDALAACSRLIDKGVAGSYFNRAQLYFRNGDYDRAIADFSAFIRSNPSSVAAFNERGLSSERKGDYDRAISDYSEAIRLDRGSVLPYNNRGSVYEKKGELDKALADFREALSHGSTTATVDIERVERAIRSLSAKYVVNGLGGLSVGSRVSFDTSDYREYQCAPSEQFEGLHVV